MVLDKQFFSYSLFRVVSYESLCTLCVKKLSLFTELKNTYYIGIKI